MDIIAHIKSRGMTVSAVARMSGVTRPTIYKLQHADYNPHINTVEAVARVLGLGIAEIRPELNE